MTLRKRLILWVSLLTTAAILSTAALFVYASWQFTMERAKVDGTAVASLLAQTISAAQQTPTTVSAIVGRDAMTEAELVGALVALAKDHGVSTETINDTLRDLAARGSIAEIWVTDRDGAPLYTSLDDIDRSIGEDSGITRQSIFQSLREGRRSGLFTEPLRRDVDGREYRYGAIAMPDHSGMVLVARRSDDIDGLRASTGLRRLLNMVMSGASIDAIWVFDDALATIGSASIDKVMPALTSAEQDLATNVIHNGIAASALDGGLLRGIFFGHNHLLVAAPIFDNDGLPDGVALMRLPTSKLESGIRALLMFSFALTIALLVIAIALALPFLNRIVRPLAQLTRQTETLVSQGFTANQDMRLELTRAARDHDEVGTLAGALFSMVERLEAYIANLRETTAAKERIEGELAAARAIQLGILPRDFTLGGRAECDIHAFLEPAKAVGGDLYDVFLLEDRRLFFLTGDVSDKGVPAALFMAVTKTLFSTEARRDSQSVGSILSRVNAALCLNNPEGMFVTIFAGILDLRTGTIAYSDGGHEPPFILRHDGRVEMLDKVGGLALGIMDDYAYEDGVIQLAPGDGLITYTDGLNEAMNSDHQEYLFRRIEEVLMPLSASGKAEAIIESILRDVKAFTGDEPQSDDITLLVLRWPGDESQRPSEKVIRL